MVNRAWFISEDGQLCFIKEGDEDADIPEVDFFPIKNEATSVSTPMAKKHGECLIISTTNAAFVVTMKKFDHDRQTLESVSSFTSKYKDAAKDETKAKKMKGQIPGVCFLYQIHGSICFLDLRDCFE